MNTIGGAPGIKRSAEVKETPVRSAPEEQPQAAKKRDRKIKTLTNGGGDERPPGALKKMSRFGTIWSGKLTKYECGVMFL